MGEGLKVHAVGGAADAGGAAVEDVRVDHGGADVAVAEQLLHGADVGAVLEEVVAKEWPARQSALAPDSRAGKRPAVRARAFAASATRSRGGAPVTRALSKVRAALVTSSTPRAKAASLALDGREKPLSFRTN